jgi:hypothetical protein
VTFAATVRYVLVPLLLCLACAFSSPCALDIDGHGNAGDETMTIALESDATLRSLPAYGYRPDGRPWAWASHTAPFFAVFYAPIVNAAPPLRRVEAARLVSRVLAGMSIYLLALALMQFVWRRPAQRVPAAAQLIVFAIVAFAFMNAPRFRFIASFARVDMLGFFFLAAVLASASWLLLSPTPVRVFLFTLLCVATVGTSYAAFFLAASIGGVALVAVSIELMVGPASRFARSWLANVAGPAICAVVVAWPILHLAHAAMLSGLAADTALRLRDRLAWLPATADQVAALARPERGWFLLAGWCGLTCAVLLALTRRGGAPGRTLEWWRSAMTFGIALLVTAVIYRFWMLTLGLLPIRFTYDAMLLVALGFLELLVCSFAFRHWTLGRYVTGAFVGAALVYACVSSSRPPGLLCQEESSLPQRQFWPVGGSLTGLYDPFKDLPPGNRARYLHLAAARNYLVEQGVASALATDPMLTLASEPALRYFVPNDYFYPGPSPEAEELFWRRVVAPQNIQYVVSTEFGQAEELNRAGFSTLRACLRQAAKATVSSCRFKETTVQLTRVFSTDETVSEAGIYRYAFEPSTPLTIYRMSAR